MRFGKKLLIAIIVIILLLLILTNVFKIQNIVLAKIYPIKYSEYVEKYAKEFGVDEKFVYAIIKAESNFCMDANSNSGAIGLMQIIDSTAEEIAEDLGIEYVTKESLYNPETNIMIGTKYFSDLLKDYDNNHLLALAAYNAGKGNVKKWINAGTIKEDGSDVENIPFKETNMYVRKTVRNYKIYQELYN